MPTRPLAERFWEKVDKSGECWLWTAGIGSHGRGEINVNGRPAVAYRVAWEFEVGPIPPGRYLCHDCPGGDNPLCVRPSHLFLGTQTDNMRDMWQKGRGAIGTAYKTRTKLTPDDVRAIRSRHAAGGITFASLGREYGMNEGSIRSVVYRKNWRHVA